MTFSFEQCKTDVKPYITFVTFCSSEWYQRYCMISTHNVDCCKKLYPKDYSWVHHARNEIVFSVCGAI